METNAIGNIIQTLSNDPANNLEEGIFELNELKRQKSSIENSRTIALWKTQLIDALYKMNKKENGRYLKHIDFPKFTYSDEDTHAVNKLSVPILWFTWLN